MAAEILRTETGFKVGGVEALLGTSGRGQLLRANSLVLHGPRKIVVDPAGGENVHQALSKENPVLFYTHYHADHRASEYCYPMDAEVWAPAQDASAIRNLDHFVTRIDKQGSQNSRRMFNNLKMVFRISDRPVAREMAEGETIEAGGAKARIVAFPGHTPGHAGLFMPEESFLFLTDIDLTSFGPWYGNDVSDLPDFIQSVEKAKAFECDYYFTSHIDYPLTREEFLPLIDSFYAHFARRDGILMDALAKGEKSLDELLHLGVVYRPDQLARFENFLYFEKKHVKKHLEILAGKGAVIADAEFKRFQRV